MLVPLVFHNTVFSADVGVFAKSMSESAIVIVLVVAVVIQEAWKAIFLVLSTLSAIVVVASSKVLLVKLWAAVSHTNCSAILAGS